MIKIAVCDDDTADRDALLTILNDYCARKNPDISIEVFGASPELLNAVERGSRFDVLLLDILMPGSNGMQTASEIRRFDCYVKIIFLTSTSDFAVESYEMNTFYYRLKPISSEFLFPLLDSVLETSEKERSDKLIGAVTVSGLTEISIPRGRHNEIKNAFLRNAFCEEKTKL